MSVAPGNNGDTPGFTDSDSGYRDGLIIPVNHSDYYSSGTRLRWILPVASIVIGLLYLDPKKCPEQPALALLLIAFGGLWILSKFVGSTRFPPTETSQQTGQYLNVMCGTLESVLLAVRFVVFVISSGLAYELWSKYDPALCSPGLFYYVLYQNGFLIIFMALIPVLIFYERCFSKRKLLETVEF